MRRCDLIACIHCADSRRPSGVIDVGGVAFRINCRPLSGGIGLLIDPVLA